MCIEKLRQEFRELRSSIPDTFRREWDKTQARLADLESPPTPIEWVDQIRKFSNESRLSSAKMRWESLRSSNPAGWGESLSLTQVVGWSEDLPVVYQVALIEKQIREDLKVQLDYEAWEERER
jgi:hypothetical protein